ncbi:hypothetical protein FIM02_02750 [SAR202 cluster bacterium AD-802-E10_MRT_200m]|nr:hypothetical protein [SAR202 cluster bacterium AD-802-E10_MRT_200m]
MNIVVCIKQTPIPAEARFDPQTKTLIREGVNLTISSLDRRALLEAVRIRNVVGGNVTALSMGPQQAETALVECLALGADKGVLLTDRRFAGSDTLATARTLALALQQLNPDLILCGKFTIDSETGQVPSQIAELIKLPQITSVSSIHVDTNSQFIRIKRETDEGYETYNATLPILLSVNELIISGRRPNEEESNIGKTKPLETWHADKLNGDIDLFGTSGSPTWVGELRSSNTERKGVTISGQDAEFAISRLIEDLIQNGLFSTHVSYSNQIPRRITPQHLDPTKAIWVVAESLHGTLQEVTFELLGEAQRVANQVNGEVAVLLFGDSESTTQIGKLGAYGADTVYITNHDKLITYSTELFTAILASSISHFKPYAVLAPSITNFREILPRVAARLGLGLTGHCIGLELDQDRNLIQLKPAFGGDIIAPIYSKTTPVMATLRPGVLEACKPMWGIQPRQIFIPVPNDVNPRVTLLESQSEPTLGGFTLENSAVVVGVGLGIGGPEYLAPIQELTSVLDAAIGSTLQVATMGWLPGQTQIGLTGKSIAPQLYFAIGLSGQPYHTVGTKRAAHIVAINSDPEAPIFKSADFGIITDWRRIIPDLTQSLRAIKQEVPYNTI